MERLCINPACAMVVHDAGLLMCPECGTALRHDQRFELRRSLREITPMQGIAVYEAYDHKTEQACIVKVLLYPQPPYLRHFEQEAALLANLRHPGLPQVDIDNGGYFTVTTPVKQYPRLDCFAMEKIPGITLAEWLAQGHKLSQDQAIDWLKQLCDILGTIHQAQIFHRDIKPSNIMLKPDGKLVLIDFGAVRAVTDTYLNKLGDKRTQRDGITIFNSAGYTPYEQTQGRAVMQSDFFALSHTLIHLLTGAHPAQLETTDQGGLCWRTSAPQVATPFADLLDHMGALMPQSRPSNVAAIQHQLDQLPRLIQAEQRAKSPWIKVAKGVVIALVVGGILRGSIWYFANRHLNDGLQLALAGDFQAAQSKLKAALWFEPNNPVIHSNLATVCQQQGTEAGDQCAIKHYQRALKINPQNDAVRYNLASFYGDLGEFTQAEKAYRIILKRSPNFVNARNNLARLQIIQGQYGAATTSLDLALPQARDPLTRAVVLKNVGWLKFQLKDYPAAIAALTESIKLQSDTRTDAYCLLAKTREAQSQLQDAMVAWQQCLSGEATTPEVKLWQSEKLNQFLPKSNNPT